MGASHLSGQNLLKLSGIANLDVYGQLRRTSIFFPRSRVSNGSSLEAYLLPFSTRSEEHTSELQSLMRISYAVFCLKKKKTIHIVSVHISIIHTLELRNN